MMPFRRAECAINIHYGMIREVPPAVGEEADAEFDRGRHYRHDAFDTAIKYVSCRFICVIVGVHLHGHARVSAPHIYRDTRRNGKVVPSLARATRSGVGTTRASHLTFQARA